MNSPPPISYESTDRGISRRGFRLLLFLTLINTILLGVFVLGPGLGGFLRQQWAEYEQRRADRKVRVATLSAQQQCMRFQLPPDTLLYAEDSTGIAAMRAAGPVSILKIGAFSSFPLIRWTDPAVTYDPGCLNGVMAIGSYTNNRIPVSGAALPSGWLFLHERRAGAAGPARLIMVRICAVAAFDNHIVKKENVPQLQMTRELDLFTFVPATADQDLSMAATDSLTIGANPAPSKVLEKLDSLDGSDPTLVDVHGQLRFLAGKPDDSDPARFTLPYTLDGVPGTIAGKLFDNDHVRFEASGPLAPFVH